MKKSKPVVTESTLTYFRPEMLEGLEVTDVLAAKDGTRLTFMRKSDFKKWGVPRIEVFIPHGVMTVERYNYKILTKAVDKI